jgi:hypothetical protein
VGFFVPLSDGCCFPHGPASTRGKLAIIIKVRGTHDLLKGVCFFAMGGKWGSHRSIAHDAFLGDGGPPGWLVKEIKPVPPFVIVVVD